MVSKTQTASAGGLREFLTFLATVRGDLSSITAPPFILSHQSLVEFPTYWAERPDIFSAVAHESNAAKRMLAVLKLYLVSLQRQYYVGRTVKEGLKKPLNPFLGEIFLGEFKSENTSLKVISEQVSHHPPTTAAFVEDVNNGVTAVAYSTQGTTLSGPSVLIKQSGHAIMKVEKYRESYLIPLPDVRAKGLLSGPPYPELDGTYKIVGSSGYVAEMKFSSGRMFSGNRNLVEATVYRVDDKSGKHTQFYTVEGIWSSSFSISDAQGTLVETVDLADPKHAPVPVILPVPEQESPWESRRAWKATADALRRGDSAAVVQEKSKVENAQREMRRKEKSEGRTWEGAFFVKNGPVDVGKSVMKRRESEDSGYVTAEEGETDDEKMEMDSVEDDQDIFERLVRIGNFSEKDAERLRGRDGGWRFERAREGRWNSGVRRGDLTPLG